MLGRPKKRRTAKRGALRSLSQYSSSALQDAQSQPAAAMPKESAFAKAKVKKTGGGFGASKSGRFDAPKESWEQGPSSTSYDYDASSIGGKLKKQQQRSQLVKSVKGKDRERELGGFGSSAPKFEKNGKFNGMGSDAPGPGAYADGVNAVRSTFDGTKSKGRGFGSESKDRFSMAGTGFAREQTPDAGEYVNVGQGMGEEIKKKFQSKSKSHGFGSAPRFESRENGMGPVEVVQADYDISSALPSVAAAASKQTAVRAKGAFGSAAPKFEKVNGMGSDAPGPGAYDWTKSTGAFVAPVTPSAAFASKSDQHSTTPGTSSKSNGMGLDAAHLTVPAPGEYETSAGYEATNKHSKKSFNAASTGVGSTSAGFGMGSKARPEPKKGEPTPGPGEYKATHKSDIKGLSGAPLPSAVFSSSTKKEADRLFPSHGDMQSLTFKPPGGIGENKSMNKSSIHTFGTASRFVDYGFEELTA